MPKVLVLFYSRTGNTEKMAQAVAEGARNVQGVDVELKYYARAGELASVDALVIGMPTYDGDVTRDMKNLLEEVAAKKVDLKGKIGAAFGSYGWSGEAPHLILEILENRFEMKVLEPPLLIIDAPDEKGLTECRKLGKNVAELISRAPQED